MASLERISFVVPAYRELLNGNLQALLQAIDAQDHPNICLVAVVNNSVEVARDRSSPVFLENQKTIAALLNAHRDYAVEVVDLSTDGCERNMGLIRNAGVARASSASDVAAENHIVVHMDCDTRFDSDFTRALSATYAEGYDVVFFRRRYELRSDVDPLVRESHEAYALKRAARDLAIFLSDYREGFATYQISSRLSTLKSVGGFKPLVESEDTQLTRELLRYPHLLSPELVVRTEDRARADGFTAARRQAQLGKSERWFPARILLGALSQRLVARIREGNLSFDEAADHFASQLSRLFRENCQIENDSLAEELRRGICPTEVTVSDGAKLDPFTALFRSTMFRTSENPGEMVCRSFGVEGDLYELLKILALARKNPATYPEITAYLRDLTQGP